MDTLAKDWRTQVLLSLVLANKDCIDSSPLVWIDALSRVNTRSNQAFAWGLMLLAIKVMAA